MPSALFRSAPSSKVVVTIESAAGEMIAAPTPWTARDAIRTSALSARPQASEASVKRMRPTTKISRRPRRSASSPAEQQEAAEGDRVGRDDPLHGRLRDVQVDLDRRNRDVDDRDVEHGHEERGADDREHEPLAAGIEPAGKSSIGSFGSAVFDPAAGERDPHRSGRGR